MTIDSIEEVLDRLVENTCFQFTVEEGDNGEIELYMDGDNPENEDWNEYFVIKNPENEEELIDILSTEMYERYNDFDIEENVRCMLEAKANGFSGVPGVVALVQNEQYKENALKEFSDFLVSYNRKHNHN